VLTKPSKPAKNEGFDNEEHDYILYVNDILGAEEGQRYYNLAARALTLFELKSTISILDTKYWIFWVLVPLAKL
jgi:hypothetical protein